MSQKRPQASTDVDDTVDLLARARAGDRAALDRLFERHVPLLRRWAAGRLPRWARDAADTSDLIQEPDPDDIVLQSAQKMGAEQRSAIEAPGGSRKPAD